MSAVTDLVMRVLRFSRRPVFYPEYTDSRYLHDITTFLTDYTTLVINQLNAQILVL